MNSYNNKQMQICTHISVKIYKTLKKYIALNQANYKQKKTKDNL